MLPIWREQSKTGVIQVTDKDMSRYWIRFPEIANFVISCLEIMQGGEIFVPKMEERGLMDIAQELFPGVTCCEYRAMLVFEPSGKTPEAGIVPDIVRMLHK